MNGRHFHPVGENSTFMATNSTVFDVELLLDAERNFRYNHASFRGESRKYNDRAEARHGPLPFADLLNRKRLAEAYFR